jgi:hypothetical protein
MTAATPPRFSRSERAAEEVGTWGFKTGDWKNRPRRSSQTLHLAGDEATNDPDYLSGLESEKKRTKGKSARGFTLAWITLTSVSSAGGGGRIRTCNLRLEWR